MSTQKQITIPGQLHNAQEYRNFVQKVNEELSPNLTALEIDIQESDFMPSAALGYLMKLNVRDNIDITLRCGKPELALLLRDLRFDEKFTIQEY